MSSEYDLKRFDRWAETYDRSIMQKWYFGPVHARMIALIEKERPGSSFHDVIDVGCGTGRFLRAVALRWPQARLMGIDPAERMIFQARRLNPQASFQVAPGESLPCPDESADRIASSLSFHHWLDQARGLREIARVLRPGGLFCLADHTFTLANIFNEGARSRRQIRTLFDGAHLEIVGQGRLTIRAVLVTLARK
jgi:ubiquinone/menaquinone biosynthesis C-methylase UbiE